MKETIEEQMRMYWVWDEKSFTTLSLIKSRLADPKIFVEEEKKSMPLQFRSAVGRIDSMAKKEKELLFADKKSLRKLQLWNELRERGLNRGLEIQTFEEYVNEKQKLIV